MDKLIEEKRKDLSTLRALFEKPKLLDSRFKDIFKEDRISLIAELKPSSPVKGRFLNPDDMANILKDILETPISAISVLTDKHFSAKIENISMVRKMTSLPILRKDFIIDNIQIYESNFYEVDALLLIARILEKDKLQKLYDLTFKLGIEPIVEIYDVKELDKILPLNPSIIMINNRDLETFECNVLHTSEIMRYIPSHISVISASGISSREDILYLKDMGVRGALIGESIMTAENPKKKIMELMGIED